MSSGNPDRDRPGPVAEAGGGRPAGRLLGSTRRGRGAKLAALLLAANLCVAFGQSSTKMDLANLPVDLSDSGLYEAVVMRVHNGEPYYQVAGEELNARHYATGSVFNWRLPLYGFLPPSPYGRALLALVSAASSACAVSLVWGRHGAMTRLAVCASQINTLAWLMHPEPTLFTELWCGSFLMMSIFLISGGRPLSGIFVAGVALAIRELALPYVIVLAVYFASRRLYGKTLAVSVLSALFLLYFSAHASSVAASGLGVHASPRSWIRLGGIGFLISSTSSMYAVNLVPDLISSLVLPLSVLGLWHWRDDRLALARSTLIVYAASFLIFGMPMNYYWGWIYAPIAQLGLPLGLAALGDLLHPSTTEHPPAEAS